MCKNFLIRKIIVHLSYQNNTKKPKAMKATKKQIAEITAKAIEMNCDVELALSIIPLTSKSVYDAIGAVGVVETAIKKGIDQQTRGFILLDDCKWIRETEKAYLLEISRGFEYVQRWVAKSLVTEHNGYTVFPAWIVK